MILKRRHWVNSRRRNPWVTRVAYNVETGTVLFCKHADEESQISGIEDGRAPVFDMGAVWGSSGASTGRACLGRNGRGSVCGRGSQPGSWEVGCTLWEVSGSGGMRREASLLGVCGNLVRVGVMVITTVSSR